MSPQSKPNKPLIVWLFSGCLLVFAMVVIGGITRLTESGLSIVEWNVIMGSVPPLNHQEWDQEFQKYQQSPEFKIVNSAFTIEDFKSIFWWEYLHRLLGRLVGIVFLIPFIYFYLKKQLDPTLIKKLVVIFLLGGLQGFLGWYMVSSGLVNNPHVSHFRLASHLLLAFFVCGFIFWVALDEMNLPEINYTIKSGVRTFVILIFFVLMIQILFGAFTAGLDAGRIYNTWPDMEGSLVPETVPFTIERDGISSLINNPGSIQFMHRMIAYLLSMIILGYFFYCRKQKLPNKIRSVNMIFYSLIILQIILGIFTVIYAVPVFLGVFHQLIAFCSMMVLIYLMHLLRRGQSCFHHLI